MNHCPKEKEIEGIKDDIKSLNKVMYRSNGNSGLLDMAKALVLDMQLVKADLKDLLIYKIEQETKYNTKEGHRKERKSDRKFLIASLITSFIAVAGMILTVILS